MKTIYATAAAAALLFVGGQAKAQIPVTDAASIAEQAIQHAESIAKYAEQIQEMQRQYEQMKQQYESLTGSRGMANLFRSNDTMIPTSWQETLSQMQSGKVGDYSDELMTAALELAEPGMSVTADDVSSTMKSVMTESANSTAQNASVFDQTKERQEKINQLANKIDSAPDLKAAIDLNNRLAAEQAMLSNEIIRLQSMNAMTENNRRLQSQRATAETSYFGRHVYEGADQ